MLEGTIKSGLRATTAHGTEGGGGNKGMSQEEQRSLQKEKEEQYGKTLLMVTLTKANLKVIMYCRPYGSHNGSIRGKIDNVQALIKRKKGGTEIMSFVNSCTLPQQKNK